MVLMELGSFAPDERSVRTEQEAVRQGCVGCVVVGVRKARVALQVVVCRAWFLFILGDVASKWSGKNHMYQNFIIPFHIKTFSAFVVVAFWFEHFFVHSTS